MGIKPWYNDSTNYNVQAKSIVDYLARSNKFLEYVIEDYEVFQEIIVAEMKQAKFDAELEVEDILLNWLEDGTLYRIINDEVFKNKADKDWVDEQLNQLREDIQNDLNETTDQVKKDLKDTTDKMEKDIEDIYGRISNIVSISLYDVDPTGQRDSLQGFKDALNDLSDYGTLVLQENAHYLLSDKLEIISDKNITIQGQGATLHTIVQGGDVDESRAISFKGEFKRTTQIVGGIEAGQTIINVQSTSNIKENDLLHIFSTEQFNGARAYYKKGGAFTVAKVISSNQLKIYEHLPYNINSNQLTQAHIYSPIKVTVKDLNVVGDRPLPHSYVGLAIENSVNSKIENVYSDNFNHCFLLKNHVNTVVEHVRSGRSFYEGTREAYGLASYMGHHLTVRNSTFNSGRHGLEISGFENSFKTTIENVTANSETDQIGFNMHQSSYDTIVRNSSFDAVGLSGHVIMDGCIIGNKVISNLKTGNRYMDSSFLFTSCSFLGDENFIRLTDDAQVQPNNARYIGTVQIENSRVQGRLQLNMYTTYSQTVVDRLFINGTNNFNINNMSECRINRVHLDNFHIDHNENIIVATNSRISDLIITNAIINQKYDIIKMTDFGTVLFDNIRVVEVDNEPGRMELGSHTDSGTPKGKVIVQNSDLSLIPLTSTGFDQLQLNNANMTFGTGRSNITAIYENTMTNIT